MSGGFLLQLKFLILLVVIELLREGSLYSYFMQDFSEISERYTHVFSIQYTSVVLVLQNQDCNIRSVFVLQNQDCSLLQTA